MHLGIGVGAAVGQHEGPIVEVVRLDHRGQHHPAGADAGQDEVSIPMSCSWSCRSVVEKAPTRVLRTTTSPAAGSTRSSMAVVGESAWKRLARTAH